MSEKDTNYDVTVAAIPPRVEQYRQQHDGSTASKAGLLNKWSPTALLVSYFVFSIALYTILPDTATKIFWFLYLTIATLVAGVTFLEAYDGLTPLRDARKAIAKSEADDGKWKVNEEELPFVDLVFDRTGDHAPLSAVAAVEQCVNELTYPRNKVRAFVLVSDSRPSSPFDSSHDAAANILPIPVYATSSLSSCLAYFFGQLGSSATITAFFTGKQLPHPHAVRLAAERLSQDGKVDVVQGRSVFVPRTSRASVFASLACLEHDLNEAVLYPGRGETWGVNVPDGSNAYWRTDILRNAASSTAPVRSDGRDLGFAAVRNGARAKYDLRVSAHEPCARSFSQYWQRHTGIARQMLLATTRYTGLVFRRSSAKQDKEALQWTTKKRFGIIYMLPITCLASHAVCQYFSMALALLFTQTPRSTSEFARTVYFQYPVSEWLMVSG